MAKATLAAKFLSFGTVLTVVIAVSIVKLHLLAMPLERDEGEYAYIAQLLMHGSPLYLNAFSAKLPGIYLFYAIIMTLFGQSSYGIHLGLLVLNAASTMLVFLLARRLLDTHAGVIAAAVFALLTLGKYAFAFNIEHLVVFFFLSGSILMLRALDTGSGFLLSGLLFGSAFMTKQHAAFFVLFAAFYIVWSHMAARPPALKAGVKRTALFLSGAALPFMAACFIFYMQGVFKSFWFWIFMYASKYCTLMKFSDGIGSFLYISNKMIGSSPILWAVAGAGLVAMRWSSLERPKAVFIAAFSACSFLAITPGLYFRHHYFILLFPAVALSAGIAARFLERYLSGKGVAVGRRAAILAVLFAALFGYSVFQARQFLFQMSPESAVHCIYIRSPIAESVEVAKYIESRSDKDSRIIVLGSEPQIYFYLQRRAPVSYIYMYPLLEDTPYAALMQERFKKEVESAGVEYLIIVHISTSWFNWYANEKIGKPLFDWIDAYRKEHYDIVGVVDMVSHDKSVYLWDDAARIYRPRSDSYMLVFKRKAA